MPAQDPPFGIHLCGPSSDGYLVLNQPVVPVHDERVRPYRPIPMFRADTVVQHYMRAEEMKPYYNQALQAAEQQQQQLQDAGSPGECEALAGGSAAKNGPTGCAPTSAQPCASGLQSPSGAAEQLYSTLVQLGLLRR